jgi:hypothetical protein
MGCDALIKLIRKKIGSIKNFIVKVNGFETAI